MAVGAHGEHLARARQRGGDIDHCGACAEGD